MFHWGRMEQNTSVFFWEEEQALWHCILLFYFGPSHAYSSPVVWVHTDPMQSVMNIQQLAQIVPQLFSHVNSNYKAQHAWLSFYDLSALVGTWSNSCQQSSSCHAQGNRSSNYMINLLIKTECKSFQDIIWILGANNRKSKNIYNLNRNHEQGVF